MATIAKSTAGDNASATITETNLTGTDTLVYDASAVLVLRNSTASSATVSLHGSTSTGTKPVEGGGSVDLSVPFAVTVAAGAVKSIKLGSIRDLLKGTIAVTGGVTGVYAYLLA